MIVFIPSEAREPYNYEGVWIRNFASVGSNRAVDDLV
jgi:hypothetical protein